MQKKLNDNKSERDFKTEQVRERKPFPQFLASFIINDMTGACKRRGLTVQNCGISQAELGYLVRLNWEGHIDRKTARQSLDFMLDKSLEIREFLAYVSDFSSNKIADFLKENECAND